MIVNYPTVVMLPLMMVGFFLQANDSNWSIFFYAAVIFIMLMTITTREEEIKSKDEKVIE